MVFKALVGSRKSARGWRLVHRYPQPGFYLDHTGSKMLVYPDGTVLGSVGGGELENRVIQAALQAMQDGQSRLLEYSIARPGPRRPGVCGGQVEVYVEQITPKPFWLWWEVGMLRQSGSAPGKMAEFTRGCRR